MMPARLFRSVHEAVWPHIHGLKSLSGRFPAAIRQNFTG